MLSRKNSKFPQKGFTFIEVLVAISVITVGIGGVYGLIIFIFSSGNLNSQKLVAYYLAQEGIELVRNIRDTNWLENLDWMQGGLTTYSTPPNQMSMVAYNSPDLFNGAHTVAFICLGNSGFFYYNFTQMPVTEENSCNPLNSSRTPYKRTVSLFQNSDNNPATEDLRVVVDVKWKERGRDYVVAVEEILYNWR